MPAPYGACASCGRAYFRGMRGRLSARHGPASIQGTQELTMPADLRDHPHHHDHPHDHAHSDGPSDPALRTKALESLLTEKGLVDPAAIDTWIEAYETKIGPRRGAQIVARAWTDPAFKAQLLEDASRAIEPFGFLGRE